MWVKCKDRQPGKFGEYLVLRRLYGGRTLVDSCIWDAGCWISTAQTILDGVEGWWADD